MKGDYEHIRKPSPYWEAMSKRWRIPELLLGGTLAMRKAGTEVLPMHDKEQVRKYESRRDRSVLMPAYQNALELAVSRPFAKPVTYAGSLPGDLEAFWEDVDAVGRDMTAFAREWFFAGLHFGMAHVLVDAPSVVASNLEEEMAIGIRPRARVILPTDLINWHHHHDPARGLVLDSITFREVVDGDDGSEVEQWKVIKSLPGQPATWETFREVRDQSGQKRLVPHASGAFEFDGIPLTTFYGYQDGPMQCRPPFEHLAHLNVAHYQSDSEQRDLLQFARVGVWFASGWGEDELKRGLTIGAHRFVGSTNEAASLEVVEHSGAAIGLGQESIDRLEARMQMVAHDTISRAPTDQMRATTAVIGERRQESQIGSWVQQMNKCIEQVVQHASEWRVGADIPEEFQARVFSDFVVGLRGDADVGQLHQMRAVGDLSRQTYFEELQRRGFLSDTVTVEEEEMRLEAETMEIPRSVEEVSPEREDPELTGLQDGTSDTLPTE